MEKYEKIVHTIVDPIISTPESIIVRELPSDKEDHINLLICAHQSDIGKLIGKKGIIANAIRDVVGVASKLEDKHIHITFEAFNED